MVIGDTLHPIATHISIWSTHIHTYYYYIIYTIIICILRCIHILLTNASEFQANHEEASSCLLILVRKS